MRVPASVRISFSLTLLTAAVLMVAELFGLVPDASRLELEVRKRLCEALALQVSRAAGRNEVSLLRVQIEEFVQRDPKVLSAALRDPNAAIIAQTGDHATLWTDPGEGRSTGDHIKVPIHSQGEPWGTIEVSFTPLRAPGVVGFLSQPVYRLVGFVMLSAFLGYWLVMRRTLRELDPKSVIPERVKTAFNTLTEGVMLLDSQEQVVLANAAFGGQIGRPVGSLVGLQASQLKWCLDESVNETNTFPWRKTLQNGSIETGFRLTITLDEGGTRSFIANSAPVLDEAGKQRGALVTFDDVTELEQQNTKLEMTVKQLQKTEKEVKLKNKELHTLATRDPLTGLLNRRSFFEDFDVFIVQAREESLPLSCIMIDIDHFKNINDTFGHATGDKVIKFLAKTLLKNSRDADLIGRYGGEEFCMVLPGQDINQASLVAERIRQAVERTSAAKFSGNASITSSLGVACLIDEDTEASDLVNRADQALYVAKQTGRNKVIRWTEENLNSETKAEAKTDNSEKIATDTILENQNNPFLAPPGKETREVDLLKLNPLTSSVTLLASRVKQLEDQLGKQKAELRRMRDYDELTGLPSHVIFSDRVNQAIAISRRDKKTVAVMSVDLNMFKRVNDTLGRVVGDGLLREVAQRLGLIIRDSDTVALMSIEKPLSTLSRIASDEFGILVNNLHDATSVTWIVKRILDELSTTFEISNHEIYVNAAIGIALYPNDGDTAEILVKNAGIARRYAKEGLGRRKYQFFAEELNTASTNYLHLESQLRTAIDTDQFAVHYQPIINRSDGNMVSMEALVRWQHPDKGIISPAEFIPLAERSGIILELGELILSKACRQAKAWSDAGISYQRVAVNLSGVQLADPNIVESIRCVLDKLQFDPHRLEIELTESAIVENIEHAKKCMLALKKLGITLSIDDFGTGYSSLSYLRNFPIDCIKIDRSFLPDIHDDSRARALYKAIVTMAQTIGLKVVAEGIETPEQLNFVDVLHCDLLQGYVLSKPLPAQQLEHSLQNRQISWLQEAYSSA